MAGAAWAGEEGDWSEGRRRGVRGECADERRRAVVPSGGGTTAVHSWRRLGAKRPSLRGLSPVHPPAPNTSARTNESANAHPTRETLPAPCRWGPRPPPQLAAAALRCPSSAGRLPAATDCPPSATSPRPPSHPQATCAGWCARATAATRAATAAWTWRRRPATWIPTRPLCRSASRTLVSARWWMARGCTLQVAPVFPACIALTGQHPSSAQHPSQLRCSSPPRGNRGGPCFPTAPIKGAATTQASTEAAPSPAAAPVTASAAAPAGGASAERCRSYTGWEASRGWTGMAHESAGA